MTKLCSYFSLIYCRKEGEPIIVPGHFIWGNGKEFAENAVQFMHKMTERFGKIFTVRLLQQHLTIISDPHSYERLSRECNFDFDGIQEQVNGNVFNFKLWDAKKMIAQTSRKVSGKYLFSNMNSFANHLNNAFNAHGGHNEWKEDNLRAFGSNTMFRAIFRTIFGTEDSGDVFEPTTVYKNFDVFHKYFNFLWLGLPIQMFPEARKALNILSQMPNSEDMINRPDVSDYIKSATEFMKAHGQTESDIIGHNLVFLHVNYNTFRVAFWLMYYLTQHEEALEALRREIDDCIQVNGQYCKDNENVEITLSDLQSLPVLGKFFFLLL